MEYGDKYPIKESLKQSATQIREKYIRKIIPPAPFRNFRSNVAVAEVYIQDNIVFCTGGTANKDSPIPIPLPKSQGGQLQPGIDPYSKRLMDTDKEKNIMVLTSDLFTNSHNSLLKAIPDSLKNLLDEINLKHYQELQQIASK